MPRLVNGVPKYRLHRASGQAMATIAGRDYYLGPWKSRASRVEYDRLIGEWLAAGRPAYQTTEPAALTVTELICQYWRFAKSHYRKHGRTTSELTCIRCALKGVRRLYGSTPAAAFGPLALKAVRQQYVEHDMARSTVNKYTARVRRMFRWGVAEELIPASVHQALASVTGLQKGRTTTRESKPVLPVDDATVQAVLPMLPEVVRDMVQLQRLLGCRPSELCDLRPGDIDRSGDVWLYTPREHKTEHRGRDRVICIGPKAQAILVPYLCRPADTYCFSPMDSEQRRNAQRHQRRRTPIHCGNRPGSNRQHKPLRTVGNRYDVAAYRRAITRACDSANVPRWSPNQLRHAAATEIRKRFGLEASQVALGHASANVTQIYAERDLTLARRIAQEVG